MPKTDIDYSNTIIYKITCKDPQITDIYVGHTTNFVQRKYAHKQCCINMKSCNYSCKLYDTMRNNGGWNNWNMEIVGFFNCKDHYEARIKEQEYFVLLNANLNSIEPMPKPKEKIQKSEPIEKKIYYCEICEVKLQNLKCMELHNQTNKHIKKQNQIIEQDNNIINKNLKKPKSLVCEICDFATARTQDYEMHLVTAKHKRKLLETNQNLTVIPSVNFHCNECNYSTLKKNLFEKHQNSIKHIRNINREPTVNKHICNICNKEYLNNSGLWKHKKLCLVLENKPELLDSKKELTNEHREPDAKPPILTVELFMDLMKQNKELQNCLMESHNKIVELSKNSGTVNTNCNNNNHFNLNFFLNETCKNAMNIQDFIQSIKLTTQDFETTGRIGFVDGISRIFINELKRLEVERRPLHCTDVKRETVYVKDNDTWEKENQEKKKLKWAINSIAQLNLNQVQEWQQEYPECRENNTVANTQFNKMAMVALGGFGNDEETKFRDKIVKNVLKEIIIDKEI